MTAAELVRGQNHPLPGSPVEVRVAAGAGALVCLALADAAGRLPGSWALVRPGLPVPPGVSLWEPGADGTGGAAVELALLPADVHRVGLVLALPPGAGGPARFGALPAPWATVTGPDGAAVVRYEVSGLDAETALVVLELYRRQDAWKVRAVGQGYAGGLPDLLADHGMAAAEAELLARSACAEAGTTPAAGTGLPGRVCGTAAAAAAALAASGPPTAVPEAGPPTAAGPVPEAGPPAVAAPLPDAGPPTVAAPVPGPGPAGSGIDYAHPRRSAAAPAAPAAQDAGGAPAPVAGDAPGWSLEERLYNQVWGMFEDLARAMAAYRSAVEFADARFERELDRSLTDPRARLGGAVDAARDTAEARRAELVDQARAVLDAGLAQLAAEAEVVEPALPAAFARWDSARWRDRAHPDQPAMAVRLGDLSLPEAPELRVPMLVRLPLERGLWIDHGRTGSEAAMAMDTPELRAAALDTAVALTLRLLAAHPAGALAVHAIDPAGAAAAALAPLAGLLAEPPAAGAAGTAALLERLTGQVDLLQMAARGGAREALPPGLDPAARLLIVHDFPHGFDDRSVARLRYLADEGPGVGLHLLMVADRDEASAHGPLLDPLWRSLLRLSPVPDDHLADPWVGHAWTYEPLRPTPGEVRQVLARLGTVPPG
ncbi:TerD family protein [Streptomyces sp. NPDC089919]|uniref:TerD family protein n=1 Tax=Streptomyces sp. NPDC089919 TaxID=3155188 RepID=UPI00342D3164